MSRSRARNSQATAQKASGNTRHTDQTWKLGQALSSSACFGYEFSAHLAVKISLKLSPFVHANWRCSWVRTVHSLFPQSGDLVCRANAFLSLLFVLQSTRNCWLISVAALMSDRQQFSQWQLENVGWPWMKDLNALWKLRVNASYQIYTIIYR